MVSVPNEVQQGGRTEDLGVPGDVYEAAFFFELLRQECCSTHNTVSTLRLI